MEIRDGHNGMKEERFFLSKLLRCSVCWDDNEWHCVRHQASVSIQEDVGISDRHFDG